MSEVDESQQFEQLLEYLRYSRGFDFTGYKRAGLLRRVQKRMQLVGVTNFDGYRDYLEVHADEFAHLFNTILINVTSFFRDEEAWNFLAKVAIPEQILARKTVDDPIRVWSAGCSNGAEAYTLAMILAEILGAEEFNKRVKVYATDIDDEALTQARQGSYSEGEMESVPAELREKYFTFADGRYLFRADLRRAVIFGRHDLLQDAPISHIDLLVCRNTLMYFNAEAQGRIIQRFHYALNSGGILFLGKAEMMLSRTTLFNTLDLKCRIFVKMPREESIERIRAFVPPTHGDGAQATRLAQLRDAAFESSPVAQIVVDVDGRLAAANAQARADFGLAPQDIGRPFKDLEVSFRPVELRSLIERVTTEHRALEVPNIVRSLPKHERQYLDIRVIPLQDANGTLGVSIHFEDKTTLHRMQDELLQYKTELDTASEELQSTNEELETTNEELQSTNEELETTNEELQSTNEELETMNEELQSTNEELQTMNDELRVRTEEVNQSNSFLESILAGLHNGVVVTDSKTNILVWNLWMEELWGLRKREVQGASLLSLDIGLPVEQLSGPLRACLAGEKDYQQITLSATNRRGRTFTLHVAVAPLFNAQHERRGAILIMEEDGRRGTEQV
ncbi:MAG: CheR family methyltransferase [Armatimonadota bacterium]